MFVEDAARTPHPTKRHHFPANGHHVDTGDLVIGTRSIVEHCREVTNRPDLHSATVGRWIRDRVIPTGRIPPGDKTLIASKTAITGALAGLALGTQSPKA
jgi:hypothetical protein